MPYNDGGKATDSKKYKKRNADNQEYKTDFVVIP